MNKDTCFRASIAPSISLARNYPGPGGGCRRCSMTGQNGDFATPGAGPMRSGEYPFTPRSPFFRMVLPVTKQVLTCGLVLDAFPDPLCFSMGDVRSRTATIWGKNGTQVARHLAHNQSGLPRLLGLSPCLQGNRPPRRRFGDAEAAIPFIASSRTLQFAPGTRYSYCNQNFPHSFRYIVEQRQRAAALPICCAGRYLRQGWNGKPPSSLADNAAPCPTAPRAMRAGHAGGFRAAENRILWSG